MEQKHILTYPIASCLFGIIQAGTTCHQCICWYLEKEPDRAYLLCPFCGCPTAGDTFQIPTTMPAPLETPEDDIAPLDDAVRRLKDPHTYKSGVEICEHLDEIQNKCSNATFLLEMEKEQERYTTPKTPVYTEDFHILTICQNFRNIRSICGGF